MRGIGSDLLSMKKIVLVGGYPKGYSIPFHPETRSGQILSKMCQSLDIKPTLLNLWRDKAGEANGSLSPSTRRKLRQYLSRGFVVVALGRYQEGALTAHGIDCSYLPHPASRRTVDRQKLEDGLRILFLLG